MPGSHEEWRLTVTMREIRKGGSVGFHVMIFRWIRFIRPQIGIKMLIGGAIGRVPVIYRYFFLTTKLSLIFLFEETKIVPFVFEYL